MWVFSTSAGSPSILNLSRYTKYFNLSRYNVLVSFWDQEPLNTMRKTVV